MMSSSVKISLLVLGAFFLQQCRSMAVAGSDANTEVVESTLMPRQCGTCDLRECAQVIAAECDGQIIKDECDCCPVCEPFPDYEFFEEKPGEGDTVMMIVNASHKEACSKISCTRLQICSLNIQGIPMCRCPNQYFCRNQNRRDVCGEDGETYRSRCFLRMKECSENRRIRIKHRGPCFKGDPQGKQKRKKDRIAARLEKKNNRKAKKDRESDGMFALKKNKSKDTEKKTKAERKMEKEMKKQNRLEKKQERRAERKKLRKEGKKARRMQRKRDNDETVRERRRNKRNNRRLRNAKNRRNNVQRAFALGITK